MRAHLDRALGVDDPDLRLQLLAILPRGGLEVRDPWIREAEELLAALPAERRSVRWDLLAPGEVQALLRGAPLDNP